VGAAPSLGLTPQATCLGSFGADSFFSVEEVVMPNKKQKWMAIAGQFNINGERLLFHGQPTPWRDEQGQEQIGYSTGVAISDSYFTGGELAARVRFKKISERSACELIFHWDPTHQARLSAGIGPPGMFSIRSWDGKAYNDFAWNGDRKNLQSSRDMIFVLSFKVQS
jgi:hypothetical protein